jgi:hypothetical protein
MSCEPVLEDPPAASDDETPLEIETDDWGDKLARSEESIVLHRCWVGDDDGFKPGAEAE